MQTMRYINLLDRTSHVKTMKCYIYNNTIIFGVPKAFMAKAIGPDAEHIHAIQDKIGKRVKIVEESKGVEDLEKFISSIVAPVTFKSVEVKDEFVVLTAGSQSKAALIGRNRRRLIELDQILKDTFGFNLKIV